MGRLQEDEEEHSAWNLQSWRATYSKGLGVICLSSAETGAKALNEVTLTKRRSGFELISLQAFIRGAKVKEDQEDLGLWRARSED